MLELRVRRVGEEVLVTVCDTELLGKEFKEGEIKLKVSEEFYRGKKATLPECLKAMKEATIANLVGSIVEEAIKEGLVDPRCVLRIQGVPHAQFVRM
ncbi:MAG: DUF424 domain-containing protein [Hadesarchaea archaeon]|nr:MAG: DUF424 domain-containing protein [Hadesarchaea archaeon]TDA33868.1 MAG: DUF424 domain-containing protein [Hadesarchaea archaeon]